MLCSPSPCQLPWWPAWGNRAPPSPSHCTHTYSRILTDRLGSRQDTSRIFFMLILNQSVHFTCYFFNWFFFFPFIGCAGSLWLCGLLSGCGTRASHCDGFSYCRAWALGAQASVLGAPRLWSTGSGAVAHRHSCSKAGGIFLDQGLNCWQADSLPLSHQGSPYFTS